MDERISILKQKKEKNAANDFEKDFFKLMINSIYGKKNEEFKKKNDCKISE